MLVGLRYFNSRLLSVPLSCVAEDIYQLCTSIFKGPVKQRVKNTGSCCGLWLNPIIFQKAKTT